MSDPAFAILAILATIGGGWALTAASYWLRDWNAALEERRRREDLAAYRSALAALDHEERRALAEWERHVATAPGVDETPMFTELAAEQMRDRLADDDEIKRWLA